MGQPKIGYAAMLEQFGPDEVLDLCAAAEAAGFSGVMAADHFQPWTPQQGQASFVWEVLAIAGARTKGDLGPGVTCPSFRMHPAIVAQAAATLEVIYPGRTWLGLGSGEALNEHVVAGYWPETPERINRMFEAIEIIRKLFSGKDVKHDGRYFKLETTRLWTMPNVPPPIYIATAGPVTAKRTGALADGLITVGAPEGKIEMIFDKFEEGAREAGKDPAPMPKILQLHVSWAESDEQAVRNAMEEWPNGGMKFPKADIRSPGDFEQMAKLVRPEDFAGRMEMSADLEVHRKQIQKFLDIGFDQIYLHNVGRNQAEWIDAFGREVLPGLTA
ncbi:MAG TPA: TIGR03557 family F420-dependent LLM class oxidoreductase [Candidatus Limnocylindrales bacterium]|jgi:F420-dependent oxidoreductase, G6PDH family|nr:TIGR03557 family F420-dependent LLM class oxidoreductase [Candidatus Limnocylindrales bacterium]